MLEKRNKLKLQNIHTKENPPKDKFEYYLNLVNLLYHPLSAMERKSNNFQFVVNRCERYIVKSMWSVEFLQYKYLPNCMSRCKEVLLDVPSKVSNLGF